MCAIVSIAFDMGFAKTNSERSTGKLLYRVNILYYIAWIEGTAIFIAVLVVTIVGSYNDYKKEE